MVIVPYRNNKGLVFFFALFILFINETLKRIEKDIRMFASILNVLKPKASPKVSDFGLRVPDDLRDRLNAMKFNAKYKRSKTLSDLYKELIEEGFHYDDARVIADYLSSFLKIYSHYTIEELTM